MNKILIYITLVVIVLGGCRKVDLPAPENNDPVFSIEAISVDDTLNWIAGENDFYMFSDFSLGSFEIYTLTGRLAKDDNCITNCDSSLTFSIRSSDLFPNGFLIDQAIDTGEFDYFKNAISQDTFYRYQFNGGFIDSSINVQPISYFWVVEADTIDSLQGAQPSFDYYGNSNLDVTLEIGTSGNCTASIRKILPFAMQDNCDLSYTISYDSLGLVNGIFAFSNNPNHQPKWIISDSNYLDLSNTLQNSTYSLTAGNALGGCFTAIDICVEATPNGVISSIAIPKFDYMINQMVDNQGGSEQFSTAMIEYKVDSKIYSSKYGSNDNFKFKILNIEDYLDNELGQKTKKLIIEYFAQLCTEDLNDCRFIEGSGVIAVAYPE